MTMKDVFGYCFSMKSNAYFAQTAKGVDICYRKGWGVLECFRDSDSFYELSLQERNEFDKFASEYGEFFVYLIKKAEEREAEGKCLLLYHPSAYK